MHYLTMQFINVFLLVFGLLLAIAGIFTVYFGAGKSRKLGAGILVGGLAVMGLTYWLYSAGYTAPWSGIDFISYLKGPIVDIVAALLAGIVAILVFIGIITKA